MNPLLQTTVHNCSPMHNKGKNIISVYSNITLIFYLLIS